MSDFKMKISSYLRNSKGFTLLEILLVVAAIAILAGIVILAINPGKQLADTRNAQRQQDINTIINAVYQYSLDNDGNLPSTITDTVTEICVSDGVAACTSTIDLSVLTTNGVYLQAIPVDPSGATGDGTGYEIGLVGTAPNQRVTVNAPNAEQGATISGTL